MIEKDCCYILKILFSSKDIHGSWCSSREDSLEPIWQSSCFLTSPAVSLTPFNPLNLCLRLNYSHLSHFAYTTAIWFLCIKTLLSKFKRYVTICMAYYLHDTNHCKHVLYFCCFFLYLLSLGHNRILSKVKGWRQFPLWITQISSSAGKTVFQKLSCSSGRVKRQPWNEEPPQISYSSIKCQFLSTELLVLAWI